MNQREDAHAEIVRLLEAARAEAAGNWCYWVCQDVEDRLGLCAGDEKTHDDPEYGAALDALRAIHHALDYVRRIGA
ncbi:hypothetical protein FFT09_14545 [Saccharomonospora piscinae]|uniref:hypothetical protein n=1 Tax=Saccharomonospora piscinae TaxID=687388 RepID=UPI00110663C8|nr:hypothetical protein [Saccharomonospora piscinae]TLW92097.1 hypothetical protein FFT09_14545 [Saccharomonospora piscinae]